MKRIILLSLALLFCLQGIKVQASENKKENFWLMPLKHTLFVGMMIPGCMFYNYFNTNSDVDVIDDSVRLCYYYSLLRFTDKASRDLAYFLLRPKEESEEK